MKIYDIREPDAKGTGSYCAALGRFDGVHTAHRELIKSAQNASLMYKGSRVAIVTFFDEPPGSITTFGEKSEIFESLGVQALFAVPFEAVRDLSPSEFFENVLKKIGCVHLSCGFNYRFGKGASGNADTLSALCKESSVGCNVTGEVKKGGKTVSSTSIRALLSKGEVKEAESLLDMPFFIDGEVKEGYKKGREIGFPTLNLCYPEKKIMLPCGVYLTKCIIREREYFGITNIGYNPTLPKSSIMAETHILAEIPEIYGENVRIYFKDRIRDEMKFSNLEELSAQIEKDKKTAYTIING